MDFSTMFGSSPDKAVNSPTRTPTKDKAERDDVGVLPVLVRTLCKLNAADGGEGNALKLGTQKISKVVLVGRLEEMEVLTTQAEFTINDGTGTMKVKDYSEDFQRSGLEVGTFVRVIGNPRPSSGEFYVSVMHMRPVSDKLEVPHHRIAALAAYCKFDRAGAKPVMDFSSETVTPEKVTAPKVEKECVKVEIKTEPQESLEAGLERVIKAATEKAEDVGISIPELCMKLKFPEAEIRAAVNAGLENGGLMNTLDDDHVATVA